MAKSRYENIADNDAESVLEEKLRLSFEPESVTLQASILRKAPSALTGAITWSKAG